MREIEIKARVKNEPALMEALAAAQVTLSEPVKQHDVVYSLPGATDNERDANWLRIRTENDTEHIFTLKRSVIGELDSIEHEVMVDSDDELRAIISYLGYVQFSDLTKVRRKAQVGEFEICFDTVAPLGSFIEVEKLCADDVDGAAVVRELWEFLEPFGITKEDAETHGYDVLMRQHDGVA